MHDDTIYRSPRGIFDHLIRHLTHAQPIAAVSALARPEVESLTYADTAILAAQDRHALN